MGYTRCGMGSGIQTIKHEFLIIHQNGGPSSYDTRWFYYSKNGVLSLVNSTMSGAGGSNPYTYRLADGSNLQVYNYFSSSYWRCKFTSSKDRDIKINLNFDGSGPTTYHLTANTESEEILIPQLTEYTGYNSNPRYDGGPGLIIEIVDDDPTDINNCCPIEIVSMQYAAGFRIGICNKNGTKWGAAPSDPNAYLNDNTESILSINSELSYGNGFIAKKSGFYAYCKVSNGYVINTYFINPFYVEAGNKICQETDSYSAIFTYYLGETNPNL